MIYFVTLLFLGILALLYDFSGLRIGRKFSYFLALIILVLIAGFRYKVGGDTQNYMLHYQYMPDLSGILAYGDIEDKMQPLWLVFVAFAKTLSSSFYTLQIMHSLVVNISVFVFFKRTTRYYFTAILIYAIGAYPLFNFEIMRESLAISLFLWSYLSYRDGRWRKFYFFITLAFLFHASALFLFLLPLLRWRQPIIIITPVIFAVGIPLGSLLRGYLGDGQSLGWLLGYVSAYSGYVATAFGLVGLFVSFVIFPFLMTMISGLSRDNKNSIRALMITGIWVGATTSLFFIFFRLLNYFTPVYMVVASTAVHRVFRMRGPASVRTLAAVALLLAIFTFYSLHYFSDTSNVVDGTRWYSRWYPYHSIFDEVQDLAREKGQSVAQ